MNDTSWMAYAAAGLFLYTSTEKERQNRELKKRLEEEQEALLKSNKEVQLVSPNEDYFAYFLEDVMIKKSKEMTAKVVANFKTKKPDLKKFDNLLKKYDEYRFGNLAKINKLKEKIESYEKFLKENELTFDGKPFKIEEIKQEIVKNKKSQNQIEIEIENLENALNQKNDMLKKAEKKYNKTNNSIFKNINKKRTDTLRKEYNDCSFAYSKTQSALKDANAQKKKAIDENKYLEDKLQKVDFTRYAGNYNQLIDVADDYKKIESTIKELNIEQEEKNKKGYKNWFAFLKDSKDPQIFKDACDLHDFFKENNFTNKIDYDYRSHFDITKYVDFGEHKNCCSEFMDFENNFNEFNKQENNVKTSNKSKDL